jgi:hypothetical protein
MRAGISTALHNARNNVAFVLHCPIFDAKDQREKLEKIFYYVRDEILFGLPKKGDLVKASETIASLVIS